MHGRDVLRPKLLVFEIVVHDGACYGRKYDSSQNRDLFVLFEARMRAVASIGGGTTVREVR